MRRGPSLTGVLTPAKVLHFFKSIAGQSRPWGHQHARRRSGLTAMDFSKLPLFSMISQRIGWLSERQKVLAENVANADTPNYKARDLKPQDFAALASAAGAGG